MYGANAQHLLNRGLPADHVGRELFHTARCSSTITGIKLQSEVALREKGCGSAGAGWDLHNDVLDRHLAKMVWRATAGSNVTTKKGETHEPFESKFYFHEHVVILGAVASDGGKRRENPPKCGFS